MMNKFLVGISFVLVLGSLCSIGLKGIQLIPEEWCRNIISVIFVVIIVKLVELVDKNFNLKRKLITISISKGKSKKKDELPTTVSIKENLAKFKDIYKTEDTK